MTENKIWSFWLRPESLLKDYFNFVEVTLISKFNERSELLIAIIIKDNYLEKDYDN